MDTIQYLEGDATRPLGKGPKIICHMCNDVGGWGKGFVLALSKRWLKPEVDFRAWFKGAGSTPFTLGAVQLVEVDEDMWVANMIAQRDIHSVGGVPPIRYDALETCLNHVVDAALKTGATLHMPRIGCGLAGGEWSEVERILMRVAVERGAGVYVYDFV